MTDRWVLVGWVFLASIIGHFGTFYPPPDRLCCFSCRRGYEATTGTVYPLWEQFQSTRGTNYANSITYTVDIKWVYPNCPAGKYQIGELECFKCACREVGGKHRAARALDQKRALVSKRHGNAWLTLSSVALPCLLTTGMKITPHNGLQGPLATSAPIARTSTTLAPWRQRIALAHCSTHAGPAATATTTASTAMPPQGPAWCRVASATSTMCATARAPRRPSPAPTSSATSAWQPPS